MNNITIHTKYIFFFIFPHPHPRPTESAQVPKRIDHPSAKPRKVRSVAEVPNAKGETSNKVRVEYQPGKICVYIS